MTDIKKNQRQLLGTVIKNAGLKTVSVLVERKVKHPFMVNTLRNPKSICS